MSRTQVLSLALFLSGIFFLFYSCNKKTQDNLPDQPAGREAGLKQVASLMSKNGRIITFPVNKKIDAYYSYKGKRLPKAINGTISEAITSPCNGTNSPTATLLSFSLNSKCGTGFTISWTYQISTNNNIVATNASSSVSTLGQLEVDNGGTPVYTDNNCSATITDNGVDASRSGYELFTVTFLSGTVSVANTSLFNGTNTLKLGANCETDCNPDNQDVPITLAPYTYGAPLAQPCDRIDPTYTVNTPGPLQVFGTDVISCSQSGYVFPDLQEFEFSTCCGFWVGELASPELSFYLPPSPATPYSNIIAAGPRGGHYGYVDPGGALELKITLSSGTYTMQTRYRNITFNNPLSFYGSDWPLPIFSGPTANCCAGPWSAVSTFSITY